MTEQYIKFIKSKNIKRIFFDRSSWMGRVAEGGLWWLWVDLLPVRSRADISLTGPVLTKAWMRAVAAGIFYCCRRFDIQVCGSPEQMAVHFVGVAGKSVCMCDECKSTEILLLHTAAQRRSVGQQLFG